MIAVNKLDLAIDDEPLTTLIENLPPDRAIFAISAATRRGLDPLLKELWRRLKE